MKILITSKGKNFLDEFDFKFGRCEYLITYDTQLNTFESTKNEFVNLEVDAGVEVARFAKDMNINTVITGRLGPKAKRDLDQFGIKYYLLNGDMVIDVVNEYRKIVRKEDTKSIMAVKAGLNG